jgi:putative FmdB family regulatory protein
MPLYEFDCAACGQRFEVIRKFSDPPLETCTLCGKGPVTRLLSSPAIQFKGTGWYITDYANKGTGGKGEGIKGEGGKGDAGAAGKSTADAASSETAKSADGDAKTDSKSAGTSSTPSSSPAASSGSKN